MAKAGTYIGESSETGITVIAEVGAGAGAEVMAAADTSCSANTTNFGLPRKSAPKTSHRSNNHQSSLVLSTRHSGRVNSSDSSSGGSVSVIKSNSVKKESKSVASTIVASSIAAAETNSAKGRNSNDCDGDADCLLEIKEDTFGKRRVSGGNNGSKSNKSYSRIFRQYLPSSLNLNYTLNRCSGINNNSCNQKRPPREIATGENRPTFKSSSSSSSTAASSSLSPSLVNAFSLFKLSFLSSTAKQEDNNKRVKSPKSYDSPSESSSKSLLLVDASHSGDNEIKIGISESHGLISGQAENTNYSYNNINNNKFPKQEINYSARKLNNNNNNVKVKRKGFLYLKARSNKKSHSQSHPNSSPAITPSATDRNHISLQVSPILSINKSSTPLLNKEQHQVTASQCDKQTLRQHLASKRKDLNNNYCNYNYNYNYNYNSSSISSLLSSASNQYDEHKACLLEGQEEEEEKDRDFGQESAVNKEKKCQLARLEGLQMKNRERIDNNKMSPKQINSSLTMNVSSRSLAKSTTPNNKMKSNNNNNHHHHYNKKKGNQKLLVASGCLLTITIFASLILSQSKLTLAQLQSSAPFSRSQQSSPVNQPLSSQAVSPIVGVPVSPNSLPSISNRGAQQQQQQQQLPPPQPAAGSLVANINCNKIKGHVTFTPNIRGAGTTVTTQISAGPPGEVYQWSIHQFPVKPGAAMCSCSPLILGTKLVDLSEMHGNLPSDQEFNVQSSLNLFGFDSPVGHSLMLRGMKTGMVACATFLPTSRKSNYRAKFHTPISGSVTIFQTAFGTSFISHLMYSNGTRRHSQHRFDLVKSEDDIVTTSLLSGVQAGSAGSNSARVVEQSFALLEQREHENELSQCKRFNNGEALLRNMTYQLAVSTENFGMRGRTSMVLPQIPFETFSSVYIIVYSEHDPNEPIACAPLKFVKPKTAAAKFQSVSVQGSVVFSQDSPYDVTVARINLNMPNSDGHSYGIDELPMIIRRKSDTRVCPNIREIIYNPHHVEPSSVPLEGEATSDQYAVGDLSGKYGSLTGKSSEKIQVNDYNLPLFGPISIVGRAMTIYSAEGVAIACSNVELTTPMTTAFATFDYGIQGQFIFRQPINDCNGDTYVYIEVSKPVNNNNGNAAATSSLSTSSNNDNLFRSLDHNWHIHVNPVDSGLDHLSTTDCLPAGPHYNPYNTSTSNIYSRDCTPFNVLRCELGDLSAKMFTIDIPPYRIKGGQEPDIGKFFGTDIDLPLCGPVSVVNRSVVVHVQDFGSQRLACSTVIEFKPRAS